MLARLVMAIVCLQGGSAWAGREEVFALIVTNNTSAMRQRPDLHYADDDGARYYQLFRSVAPESAVVLLTAFDADSRRLYPELASRARPPRRAELNRAVAQIGRAIVAARTRGSRAVLYFIFAGHGYVDHGKGYLELQDGRLGPEDLEQLIVAPLRADATHLVLDSCNSFFLVNPRKPGGRRWSTPKDMNLGFSKRYPNVGVFLSTSAEGEVYEWSEVQSGIFSHEVRSGLSGAADINGDGKISYDELEGFVAAANKAIKNENFRPKVFARGPWNKGGADLFAFRWAKGRRLLVGEGDRRLWIRDQEGSRLVDLHKARATRLDLVIPGRLDQPLFVQEEVAADGRPALKHYVVPTGGDGKPIELVALGAQPPPALARGQDEVFNRLFAEPFGPSEFDEYLRDRQREYEPIFGISSHDAARMRHYLRAFARADRQDRLLSAGVLGGVGVMLGAGGVASLADAKTKDSTGSYILMGMGGAALAAGVVRALRRSEGERAYETFERELHRPGASAESIIAHTEAHLFAIAERERRGRRALEIVSYVAGSLYLGSAIALASLPETRSDLPVAVPVTFGLGGAALIGLGVAVRFMETPMERLLRLYCEDPDLHIQFAPTALPGGGGLGVSGRF